MAVKKLINKNLPRALVTPASLALVFSGWVYSGCDGLEEPKVDKRGEQTVGSASLDGKNFADAEFKCLTLSAELPSEGVAEGDTAKEVEPLQVDSAYVDDASFRGYSLQAKTNYKTDIEPWFAKKCANCHPAVSPPDLTSYALVKATANDSYATMLDGSMPPGKALPKAEMDLFKAWIDGGLIEAGAVAPAPKAPTPGKGKPKAPAKPAISASCVAPTGLEKETPSGEASQSPSPGTNPDDKAPNPPPPPPSSTPPPPPPPPGSAQVVYLGAIETLLKAKCANCHAAGATPPDLSTYAKAKAAGNASKATIDDGSMPPPATKVTFTADEKALFDAWAKAGYLEK